MILISKIFIAFLFTILITLIKKLSIKKRRFLIILLYYQENVKNYLFA